MGRDLLKRQASLGRLFQRKSRAMVEDCIAERQREFLHFFRLRGLRESRHAPAYGESKLELADSHGMAALRVEDGPAEVWSGPPRLKITIFRGSVVRVATVGITRHFPAGSSLSPQELVRALPTVRLSFSLFQHGSRAPQTFESFPALLASLDSVDS